MKIFNWVHRKFHHNALKDADEFDRDDANKKQEVTVESQTLLVDGSILTIGTFGLAFHDHPSSYQETEPELPQEDEEEEFDSADDEEEDNESEENPLVFTTFKHDLDMTSFDVFSSTEITEYSSDSSEDKKIIGERTTLADLFLADSQLKSKNHVLNSNKKNQQEAATSVTTKTQEADQTKVNGLSFTKKLIPQVAEKSRPIKKLNQMMKKMMNRKIHPELGKHKAPAHDNNREPKELESLNESAYLLPIPIPVSYKNVATIGHCDNSLKVSDSFAGIWTVTFNLKSYCLSSPHIYAYSCGNEYLI